jgi:hypothetical protein
MLRAFAARPIGRIVLVAVATLTLVGAFLVLGPFIAIPTFLLFGLALPIYAGIKRPRLLALMGLAALLVAAPVAAVFEAQNLRAPSPPAASADQPPYGQNGSVLSDAKVTPFTGVAGNTYTFSVVVNPAYLAPHRGPLLWVNLWVSTCPYPTSNTSIYCNAGYPWIVENHSLPANLTTATTVTFPTTLHLTNVWWWQMAATIPNSTAKGQVDWIFLNPGGPYASVEGPVTGDFLATVGLIVPSLYLALFLYAGLIFFVAVLFYAFFKARERRRKAARSGAAELPPAGPGSGPGPGSASGPERTCPNCGAVVYATEANCWKCGRPLTVAPVAPADTPLPSTGSGGPPPSNPPP